MARKQCSAVCGLFRMWIVSVQVPGKYPLNNGCGNFLLAIFCSCITQFIFMPEHKIYFDLPERELGKVDANFYIYQDGKKLGQITLSKGGMDYYPNKRKRPIKINWSQLDAMIKEFESKS